MRAPSQRQGHPRYRPAMLRPELDTLGEALTTWPWVLCGAMFQRCGGVRPAGGVRPTGGVADLGITGLVLQESPVIITRVICARANVTTYGVSAARWYFRAVVFDQPGGGS